MEQAIAGSLGMNLESNHNVTNIPSYETSHEELLKMSDSSKKTMETLFCHMCLDGPFDREQHLNDHIEEIHVKTLRLRMQRLFKRGSMGHAIDPMRTCFQCYRTLRSFVALQVTPTQFDFCHAAIFGDY